MVMKTERIAGTISPEEKKEWQRQMAEDGFTYLWTWIQYVVRRHIKEKAK